LPTALDHGNDSKMSRFAYTAYARTTHRKTNTYDTYWEHFTEKKRIKNRNWQLNITKMSRTQISV